MATEANRSSQQNPGKASERVEEYLSIYLREKNNRGADKDEFEVSFQRFNNRPLTKFEFTNVMDRLKADGFICINEKGGYHMTIHNYFWDNEMGINRKSSLRTVISHLPNIQRYCETNSFNTKSIPAYIKFETKPRKVVNQQRLDPLDFNDYNFRINYKKEIRKTASDAIVQKLLPTWTNDSKYFRLIKRYTFIHSSMPYRVDCSVVRSSKKVGGKDVQSTTLQDSGLFDQPLTYEIEIELDNQKVFDNFDPRQDKSAVAQLKKVLMGGIMKVLSGIQQTNYPISYPAINLTLGKYMALIHRIPYDEYEKSREKYMTNRNAMPSKTAKERWEYRKWTPQHTSNFVGPSTISLEIENLFADTNSETTSIMNSHYVVTEKTDGTRKLLYVDDAGKMYFITLNMSVEFTGCIATSIRNTIIDGEHLLRNKHGDYINRFYAFDLYWLRGKDYRAYPFMELKGMNMGDKSKFPHGTASRHALLYKVLRRAELNIKSVTGDAVHLEVKCKTFYHNVDQSILVHCRNILAGIKSGSMFDHTPDGLIFTPIDKGVASDKMGENNKYPRKYTWRRSFKWKPPEFNTIDFLVTTKKIEGTGVDLITHKFQDGVSMTDNSPNLSYKTLLLHVGFNDKNDGYLNPYDDLLNERIIEPKDYREGNYSPQLFFPTNPVPNYKVHECHILLDGVNNASSSQTQQMLTEDIGDGREVIEDKSIVEFRYDLDAEDHWKWKPIRVRHKKTREFRNGLKNYGNAYFVANSVWRSIHNPVTEDMLMMKQPIPTREEDQSVYYNPKSKTSTYHLRQFHNYIKEMLISGVSNAGDVLLDTSVGKGGDLHKWMHSKLSFVLGVDLSSDNIKNHMNGACARYLDLKQKYRGKLSPMIFMVGNTAKNLRTGEAIRSAQDQEYLKSLYGTGTKDRETLPSMVFKNYGVLKEGANIVSSQFSLHYYFKNKNMLHSYLRNVSENCRLGGYFIGTCYNGERVFNLLSSIKSGESITISRGDEIMWEVKKMYDNATFPELDESVGMEIQVFQESINKTFSEYLVNFDYLVEVMEKYGFQLAPKEDIRHLGIHQPLDDFKNVFNLMKKNSASKLDNSHYVKKSLKMNSNEKTISFLNSYFIFKKINNVDAKSMSEKLMGMAVSEEDQMAAEMVDKVMEIPTDAKKEVEVEKVNKKISKVKSKAKSKSRDTAKNVKVTKSSATSSARPLGIKTYNPKSIKTGNAFTFFSRSANADAKYLSNYQQIPDGLKIDGKKYPSVEHYFQSRKYDDEFLKSNPDMFTDINVTSKQAKSMGTKTYMKKIKFKKFNVDNWNQRRFGIMKKALKARWEQDKRFRTILLTLDKDVYPVHYERSGEKSTWGGFISKKEGHLVGQNVLGFMLHELRLKK